MLAKAAKERDALKAELATLRSQHAEVLGTVREAVAAMREPLGEGCIQWADIGYVVDAVVIGDDCRSDYDQWQERLHIGFTALVALAEVPS